MEPLDPKLARLVYDGMVQAVPGPEVEDRVLSGLLARLPHGGPPGGEAGSGGMEPGAAAAREAGRRGGDLVGSHGSPRGGHGSPRAVDPEMGLEAVPASAGSSVLGKVLAAVIGVVAVTAGVVSFMDRDEEPPTVATSEPGRDGSAASTRAGRGTDEPTVAPSEPTAASTQRDPAPEHAPASPSTAPTAGPSPEPTPARDRDRAMPRPAIDAGTKSSTSAPATADELAAEIRQIAAADRALARGELRRALELAREHATAHPQGQLALERTAIELGARCQLGTAGAAEAAAAFLREHADAPAAAKVRTRCAPSTKSPDR